MCFRKFAVLYSIIDLIKGQSTSKKMELYIFITKDDSWRLPPRTESEWMLKNDGEEIPLYVKSQPVA